MTRRFLQEAMGQLSRWSLALGGVEIVIVPTLCGVFLLLGVFLFRRQITRLRVVAALVAFGMIALAQQVADYYFLNRFYDIQQNWHYAGYGVFAFMMFRDLHQRDMPLARIFKITFLLAVLWSSFDEGFQLLLSSRVFDLGDIAKDAWGVVTGLCLITLGDNPRGALLRNWRPLRHRRLLDYFTHPATLLLLCAILSFLFLCFGSILSEPVFVLQVLLLTAGSFLLILLTLHASQFRWGRILLATLLSAAVLVQAFFFLRHRDEQVISCRPHLMIYKGIPIPYFDLLIKPDGTLRLVDKKKHFYARDRQALFKHGADIVVVGSGLDGSGGRGFPRQTINQFNYDPFRHDGTQVIIQENRRACATFNRLKREGKHVLLVYHNTR